MARTVFIPHTMIGGGPAPSKPTKPERNRDELYAEMADCLCKLAHELARKRKRMQRRYSK
jgi:hypothetical protein